MFGHQNKFIPVLLSTGLAAAAWAWLARPPSSAEAELQDVALLDIVDVTFRPEPGGYRVQAVLINRDRRTAHSVALVARVLDKSGNLLGINPLVNVLQISPENPKRFEAWVPAGNIIDGVTAFMEPMAVSWMEQDS